MLTENLFIMVEIFFYIVLIIFGTEFFLFYRTSQMHENWNTVKAADDTTSIKQ